MGGQIGRQNEGKLVTQQIEENKPKESGLSFEFFPPRTQLMQRKFWRAVGRLEALNPDFFSVTYGALGSGKEQSLNCVRELCAESKVPVAAHLTCAAATKDELDGVVGELRSYGIQGVVALRGDAEDPAQPYEAPENGYESVPELVNKLKSHSELALSVAAYPEMHPQAKNAAADIDHLKRKLDAGADQAITQYFFDPDCYLRFRDAALKSGIDKPIIPGILPIHSFDRVVDFSQRCGASVPTKFADQYAAVAKNPEATYRLSVDLAVDLCDKLAREGVDRFHFYTLNQTDLSHSVCVKLLSSKQGLDGGEHHAA